ncbi:hypothetical protein [Tahibacter harae]|uniref:TIGR02270 family protein n=1 Tax=Tahibacter harae TaxID=2963937 RepID=A0ABT1QYC1_9GAMM|nr:hypothetical protein [Tahibacter harae]MCQ4167261.1 hypothetical protein [Tahibacter harae]
MNPNRSPVLAIVQQHCEEAAFCWLRRQDGLWSPVYRREHLARVDQLLDAHLEGLRVAGAAAAPLVLESLQRWKTADEAFASTYVLLHSRDEAGLAQLEAQLQASPELARGAAAALLWAQPDEALPLLQRWWTSRVPALRRAAVPAAMRHPRVKRDTVVLDGVEEADASLRARVFRAVGEWRLAQHRERLLDGLEDTVPLCRFEAAYALSLLGDAAGAARLGAGLEQLEGSTLRRAILAWAVAAPSENFAAIFNQLAKVGAWHRELIWALAWRGDPAGLLQLSQWLQVPEYARLAAYAICHITGADMEADELWLQDPPQPHKRVPEREDDEAEHAHDQHDHDADEDDDEHDEDAGLLPPDVPRLRQWLQMNAGRFLAGQRYLAGLPLANALAADTAEFSLPQLWQLALLRTLRGESGPLCELAQPRW